MLGRRTQAWTQSSMDTAKVIGMREDNLYRLNTLPIQALVHDSASMGELWHRRLAHLNYRALLAIKNIVTGIPVLQVDHVEHVEDVHLARMPRNSSQIVRAYPKKSWI